MTQVIEVPTNAIASNPYRRLHAYPYIASKLEALQRSIADVGLWPSIIARPIPREGLWRYEQAFGHHRLEAARRSGLTTIPIIVETLTDTQMLQYMGRENLEDYNAVFLIQLESWEAALKSGLVSATTEFRRQPVAIARLLGWVDIANNDAASPVMNNTARACSAAYALIEGGYNKRDDFRDMAVKPALELAERGLSRMEQIEKVGKSSARPRTEIEHAKRKYGQSIADTAGQVRSGAIKQRDIRSRVDFNAAARTQGERPGPLFAVFANAVADNLKRTLNTDSDADKLAAIERVLGQINLLEDWEALRRLDVELLNLAQRAEGWQKRLKPTREKVVHLQALEAGEGRAMTIKLRGVPPESATLMLDLHNDVLDAAKALLEARNFVIFEEALFRANRLRYRKQVQWAAVKEELQAHFQRQLLSISSAAFREQINSKYEPLPVLTHVRDYLSRGNGNQTAGFSFPNWKRDITERKIAARRHTATGLDKSADRLEIAMEYRPQIVDQAEPA